METPEYFHGGGVSSHFAAEKQGDHFVVEDLLDFSNDDVGEEVFVPCGGRSSGDTSSALVVTEVESCTSSLSSFGAPFSGDLCELAYDELAELEWLSKIGEESLSTEDLEKLQIISGVKSSPASFSVLPIPVAAILAEPPAAPPQRLPGKARSKRSRGAPGNWSSRLLVLSANSSSAPEKKAPTPTKKKGGAVRDGRQCLHCGSEKTPQWRTGPMGPKTLCNACGVRYKSGRLVPEYRPAASPTFMLSQHSNSHRKVLELRRQKELMQQQKQQLFGCNDNDGVGGGREDEFLIHHRAGPDFPQLI